MEVRAQLSDVHVIKTEYTQYTCTITLAHINSKWYDQFEATFNQPKKRLSSKQLKVREAW